MAETPSLDAEHYKALYAQAVPQPTRVRRGQRFDLFPPVLPMHICPPELSANVQGLSPPPYKLAWRYRMDDFQAKFCKEFGVFTGFQMYNHAQFLAKYPGQDAPAFDLDSEFCTIYIRTNGYKRITMEDIDMDLVEKVKSILEEQDPPMWYRNL
ncbi:hypothetical protein BD626DRAFT_512144 [Schizophyllum amplum]|uniref:Uncharacterized protein n=1 Tax=Schizophyllum amplum TaxID=97359 RepID=A0A550C0H9_9AGAR|nr:hypothetical protein BD626DRAFT_512144 [Auriculariopsis ampla]